MVDAASPGTEFQVFTDGACSGNPGPGGYAAVVQSAVGERELTGGAPATTNNRMELQAAIAALDSLKPGARVRVHTDSEYLRKGITEWLAGWKARGWRTADKKPVKNQDLWERLDAVARRHAVTWTWVKGHAGHPLNERADRLARDAVLRARSGPFAAAQELALAAGPGGRTTSA